jgi:acid phosphatase family membrane protein YuiD
LLPLLPSLPAAFPSPAFHLHQLYNQGPEVILASLSAVFLAQVLKFAGLWFGRKQLSFNVLVETGGMPSSHSSCMTAMATSVGLIEGFHSVDFAIALSVALVVMYDAAGLRRAAGRMASILNRMAEDFYQRHDPSQVPGRLRELLGHTPVEVLAGSGLGVALSLLWHQWLLP